ncbi:phage terminase large subunit GpA-like protein [Saonia flava]|uniref:Phage terminase large subunit GpA-like protein n=1 Tax=Saonia flava TaxID=523696 RepID=A0A846R0B9_9FLAO|nr:zinc-ribbon domain-containing protein [Saonia flava]NJB70814.1 phage terminase large subunit GpA-like protein [Saonia flava]
MILFFGTRPGKTKTIAIQNTPCPNCGQTNTLSLVTTANYFHLFWIKLFKISTDSFAECAHCKRGFYKNEFTEKMKKAL